MIAQPSRPVAAFLSAAALALVAGATLWPSTTFVPTPAICLFCGVLGGVDFVLNVALFVPLGMGLRWLSGQWKAAVLIGAVATLVVEILQWRVIAGRDASLGDFLANILGAGLGAWLAVAGLRGLNATGQLARRYAAAAAITAALVVVASIVLLQPLRPKLPQWVQWTPHREEEVPFQGRLVGAEVNGKAVQPTQVFFPAQDLPSRELSARAVISASNPQWKGQASILRMSNPEEQLFLLAHRDDMATFRTYMVAARFRLRPLKVGLKEALPVSREGDASAEAVIDGHSNPKGITLRSRRAASDIHVELRRTVGLGWALLLPRDLAIGPGWWFANATWLAALVLPVAFFTIRCRSPNDGESTAFLWWPLLSVLGVIAAAPLTGLSPLSVQEWAGVLTGVGAAALLERWMARSAGAQLPTG